MPRGRKPTGNRPLTAAQRQARYRQRQSDNGAASAPRPARPMRQVSRPQQWHAPTGQARGLKAHGARTAQAPGSVCCLVRCAARGLARWRHRRGVADHCRSRSRRTGQHRTAARLWARLTVGRDTWTTARPREPQVPPRRRSPRTGRRSLWVRVPPLWTPWTTRSAGATSPVLSTELSPKPALA